MLRTRHQRRPLVSRPIFRVGLHLLVLAGLIAALGGSAFADRYFTRGVARHEDLRLIPHTDVNPLGVNTFLHEESKPEKVEQSLDMIAAAGFGYIRQMFPWYDIEIEPGSFIDNRVGTGEPVSSWKKYDRIVDLAEERGIEIIARLDKPPRWAREGQPNLDQFPDGPPNDYARFAEYVAMVVERYRGRIRYIQIWNEPNLANEWGGQPIDPAAFTELLRLSYLAAKEANPEVVVLMPGLAPTDQTGPHNLSDLLFLEGMYEAGAKDYFDIASVMVYGYGFSPWDRRLGFGHNNFSRPILTREIMERYGDGDKPIWAAEYGWVALPEDWQGEPPPWGRAVSDEQQARYLYEGYLRAQQEWPWMGVMSIWNFRWVWPPDDPHQIDNPTRGFSIVEHDFSPRPAYERLAQARATLDRAYTGKYGAGSRYLQHDGGWRYEDGGDTPLLRPLEPGATLTIPFAGQRIDLRLAGGEARLAVTIDGQAPEGLPPTGDGRGLLSGQGTVTVADGLDDGPHTLELTALDGGDGAGGIAGFTVSRNPASLWLSPWIDAGLAGLIVLNLASLLLTVRRSAQPPSESSGPRSRMPRASAVRAAWRRGPPPDGDGRARRPAASGFRGGRDG